MNAEEQLRKWFVQLSDMVGGDLNEHSDLDEGFSWFTELTDGELDVIWQLGNDNPSIEKFLKLGQELLREVGS